jgi:hypothetical protein
LDAPCCDVFERAVAPITKANAANPAMSLPYLNFCILFVVNGSLARCIPSSGLSKFSET